MSSRVILIVDDDADFRQIVREALEESGQETATASGGAEALAYLQTHPAPALILLDWRMADSDASEFMTAFVAGPCPRSRWSS